MFNRHAWFNIDNVKNLIGLTEILSKEQYKGVYNCLEWIGFYYTKQEFDRNINIDEINDSDIYEYLTKIINSP